MKLLQTSSLSQTHAQVMCRIAEETAKTLRIRICTCIADASGRSIHSTRMDGANFTSVSIAANKAFTSAGHKKPTAILATDQNRSIELSNHSQFCVVPGGRPVFANETVVGAIGISGGTPEQDDRIAEMTVDRVQHMVKIEDGYDVPDRLLCGSGPINISPYVLQRMSDTLIGHLDGAFIDIVKNTITPGLRKLVNATDGDFAISASGTGSAAMETCFANLLHPGRKALIFVHGYFGKRMADMAGRYGADVVVKEREWGTYFSHDELKEAILAERPDVVGIVHAETSTGVLHPMEFDGTTLGELVHSVGGLLVIDTVTSIGAHEIKFADWGVDMLYAGGQKNLGCPPGASPLVVSKRAQDFIKARTEEGNIVKNWYLDLSGIMSYLGDKNTSRTYHHTAPISMNYAIAAALELLHSEGKENVYERIQGNSKQFRRRIKEELGLDCFVQDEACILYPLTTVVIPDEFLSGGKYQMVVDEMLKRHNIEINNGLGHLKGKVWRIGLMGYNSRQDVIDRLLVTLKEVMDDVRRL